MSHDSPGQENLFRNYYQLLAATDLCIGERLYMPALVLIYTAIDSVSWLASDDRNEPVRIRFEKWVNKWMLQKYPLPCTATELYAARCGILHTLTPDSDLSKKGIRKIAYAWGKADSDDLAKTIQLLDYQGLVAVHLEDILGSFRQGFADFLNALVRDDEKMDRFISKANKHFANVDISLVSQFISSQTKNDV